MRLFASGEATAGAAAGNLRPPPLIEKAGAHAALEAMQAQAHQAACCAGCD